VTPEEEQWFENPERYRILMDGRWELKDLYAVPHYFEQCYSFIYCFDATVRPIDINRIAFALRGYPWRGGYSYLNIYSVLRMQITWRDRPRIREIKYASPGWLDLALNHDVALQVAKAVSALAGSAAVAAKSYAVAHKALTSVKTEREKAKLKNIKLTAEQDATLMKLCDSHARFLGFQSVKALNKQTGSPDVTLRLLLAHQRRLRELGRYIEKGKISLPLDNEMKG
jgi:hypothetical protein